MNKLLVRTLTGAAFGIVLLGAILYGHTSFGALFTIVTMLAVNEFSNLIHEHKKTTFSTLIAVLGGGYLFFAFYAKTHLGVTASNTVLLAPYILLMVYMFVRRLFSTEGSSLEDYAYFVLTQVYAALPFALLNILSTVGASGSTYSYALPLAIFVFIWCNDTGAFFVGCSIGRHKMWERISPKKTWEGTIGGGVVAMIAGFVMSIFFTQLNMWQWMGLALVVAAAGTFGDLIESCMKREMGIKDSGNILPGHGGILDRFDSTILAVPCAIAYLSLI